jgi:hypothetical protein
MATTKGLFTTNRAYTALLRNTWVTTQYNTPVYQTDPYFNYTTILLSGDTFNTLAFNSDASLNNLNVSVLGDTKASRNSPYGTNWSVYTPATGSYVSGSNNIFNISSTTVVWTYESWVMPLTASHFFAIGSGSSYGNSITVAWSAGTANKFRVNGANGGAVLVNFESTGTYAAGAWYHVAVTRTSAGVYTLYINGVADGTQTYNAVTLASGTTIVINGVNDNNGLGNAGGSFYLSNMRFLVGTALYTGNFTVPTAPLTAIANTALLTCQSNRFVDNGPYAVALTPAGSISISKYNPVDTGSSYSNYGSAYFDGTGDYLSIPNSTNLNLGSTDFTIEGWWYPIASSNQNLIAKWWTGGTQWVVQWRSAGYFRFAVNSSTLFDFSVTLTLNSWCHFAVVRSGVNLNFYFNGVKNSTTGTIGAVTATTDITTIGQFANSGIENLSGYLSDMRVVIGTALYTGNFTPPTAPLQIASVSDSYSNAANVNYSPAANTSLLTLQYKQPHNNHTFFDSSNKNNYPITRAGNSTQGAFSPYGDRWSNYFDGTGDSLTVLANSAFAPGTGNFTVEGWYYSTAASGNQQMWAQTTGGLDYFVVMFTPATSQFRFIGNGVDAFSTAIAKPNAWNHFAVVRVGTSVTVYCNGIGGTPVTFADNFTNTTYVPTISGYTHSATNMLTGYLSNFRYVKGTAVYTGTFTPPTSPLTAISGTSLLTCQSNRLIDTSPNNFAITRNGDVSIQRFSPFLPTANASPTVNGGSAYFDGTGDHLTVLETFSLPTSTTPFTMEAWIYFPANTGLAIASTNYGGSGAIPFVLGMGTASSGSGITLGLTPCLTFFNGSSWAQGVTSSISIVLNTWNHVAGVFDGANAKIYVNGVLGGTWAAGTWQTTGQANFHIGRRWDTFADVYVTGYISDFRLVIGTAVYTGNFTPPTAPLLVSGTSSIYTSAANVNTTFAAANTSLLMNFTDAAITDSTTLNVVETLGDSRVTTANSVFGGSAMFFDGTGDYLKIPDSENFTYGSNNFTIESRIFPIQTGDRRFYNQYQNPDNQFWIRLLNSTNTIQFYAIQSTTTLFSNTSTTAVTLNTWSHVAVVRNGNGITTYLNGANVGSVAYSGSIPNYSAPLLISSYDGTNEHFLGYIDDFRITKGIARYTGNFTVSANAVPLR